MNLNLRITGQTLAAQNLRFLGSLVGAQIASWMFKSFNGIELPAEKVMAIALASYSAGLVVSIGNNIVKDHRKLHP